MERFRSAEARSLLRNKYVIIMGDSIQRGFYKDLVSLLQGDAILSNESMKKKGESSFLGDKLVEGGMMGKMHNGRNFVEARVYHTDYHLVRYYYITRCYYEYVERIMQEMEDDHLKPDIVLINSCLWDTTRYGPSSFHTFKHNIQKLMFRMRDVFPENTLLIWRTTLPVSKDVTARFLSDHLKFYENTLRYDILVANYYVRQVCMDYEVDVLDMHYNFMHRLHMRLRDGVHWNPEAHRIMTGFVLEHIADAWNVPLPKSQMAATQQRALSTQCLEKNNNIDARDNKQNTEESDRDKQRAHKRKLSHAPEKAGNSSKQARLSNREQKQDYENSPVSGGKSDQKSQRKKKNNNSNKKKPEKSDTSKQGKDIQAKKGGKHAKSRSKKVSGRNDEESERTEPSKRSQKRKHKHIRSHTAQAALHYSSRESSSATKYRYPTVTSSNSESNVNNLVEQRQFYSDVIGTRPAIPAAPVYNRYWSNTGYAAPAPDLYGVYMQRAEYSQQQYQLGYMYNTYSDWYMQHPPHGH